MRQTTQPRVPVPVASNKASNPLAVKTCGGCSGRRNSQPHRRVCGDRLEDRVLCPLGQGPRVHMNPPTQESAPEGPNLFVGSRGGESRAKGVALFPLRPCPHIQCHNAAMWVACPGEYLRLHPLLCNRDTETKKYSPNERTHQRSKNRSKQ